MTPARSYGPGLLALGALGALLQTLVRTAWQCDDAYLTHRTAWNLLAGHGPVFNPGERVQAYTHPAWLAVSALAQAATGEAWLSVLAVSLALCLVAALVLARGVAADLGAGALAVLAWAASGTLVDFGTSGLETPLLLLLLAGALATIRPGGGPPRAVLAAATLAGAALVRPDAVLFVAPWAAWALWRSGRRAFLPALVGLAPLLLWEAFSLVYYGSLVPNTALAKLHLDIPTGQLAARGLAYLLDTGRRDPLALGLALGGVGLALARGGPADRALALGGLASLAWVLRIGGDFMAGRFVAAPAFLGLGLLARQAGPVPVWARGLGAAGLVAYALAVPGARWRAGADFGQGLDDARRLGPIGVVDERAWYYPSTGLLPVLARRESIAARGWPVPPDPSAIEGLQVSREPPGIFLSEQVGLYAHFAGPGAHVVDLFALADPLLARLPYRPAGAWRAGHYPRPLPDGYLDSLATGRNRVEDPAVARLYDDVRLLTRGPLFTRARWAAIARQGFGLR